MFRRSILFLFLLATFKRSDGRTSSAGISQFWSDDIKVFDQIYGKTSDKELYGATLPPTISFDIDKKIPIQIGASEKKERYITKGQEIVENEYHPFDLEDRYAQLFAKSLYPGKPKSSSALQFISFSDIKPISESTDPETYTYLKHLEKMTEKKNEKAKHYKTHSVLSNSEADEAYKSIQDILDAHEANKNNESNEEDEELPRPKTKSNYKGVTQTRNRNRNKVKSVRGNSIKSRCVSGRCRYPQVSSRTRPYLRKIKRVRYTTR